MNVYEEYGKAMIELEILNGRIQELKGKIAVELNKVKEKK